MSAEERWGEGEGGRQRDGEAATAAMRSTSAEGSPAKGSTSADASPLDPGASVNADSRRDDVLRGYFAERAQDIHPSADLARRVAGIHPPAHGLWLSSRMKVLAFGGLAIGVAAAVALLAGHPASTSEHPSPLAPPASSTPSTPPDTSPQPGTPFIPASAGDGIDSSASPSTFGGSPASPPKPSVPSNAVPSGSSPGTPTAGTPVSR